MKEIASYVWQDTNTNKISVNHLDSRMIASTGTNLFKVSKISDSTLVPFIENIKKLPANSNFTDHKWLNCGNKIILASEKGEIFII